MARNVLLDTSNVLSEINRGNTTVAQTLKKMHGDGVNLFYDEQGYREAVTNNPRTLEAAANAQTLNDLGVKAAPKGDAALRADFHALNSAGGKQARIQDGASFSKEGTLLESKGVGNMRDAAVAATAYANQFEVFSTEHTFANPKNQQTLRDQFSNKVITTRAENRAELEASGMSPNAAKAQAKPIRGIGLPIAPESLSCHGSARASNNTDAAVGRKLLGLPPFTQAGKGAPGRPLATATPGFNPEGTNLKMMGGIMALGAIIGWLDDYFIDEATKKDAAEWEHYIRNRQPVDPETGFLLIATIKRWQPRDAAYATRSYVGIEMVEAPDLEAAKSRAMRTVRGGLPPDTETVTHEFTLMWYPPMRPKPKVSSAETDEKAHGSEFWYPAFKRLRQSLEAPPDFAEALSVLTGSWLVSMIRMLDHLLSYSPALFRNLEAQVRHVREPINRARIGLAFRAVQDHRSDSSFGLHEFLKQQNNKELYDTLPEQQKKELADWIVTGSGAQKHVVQGQWDVVMDGKTYRYSFRLSGQVIYRSPENPGGIAGEGTWTVNETGLRVEWPKTGTVEVFPAPLRESGQSAKSITKWGGTKTMVATKVNSNP